MAHLVEKVDCIASNMQCQRIMEVGKKDGEKEINYSNPKDQGWTCSMSHIRDESRPQEEVITHPDHWDHVCDVLNGPLLVSADPSISKFMQQGRH